MKSKRVNYKSDLKIQKFILIQKLFTRNTIMLFNRILFYHVADEITIAFPIPFVSIYKHIRMADATY
jgi:hypothetical protein